MARLEDYNQRLNQLNDDFSYFNAKSYPATLEQVRDFEKEHGITFPAEFVEFLTQIGTAIFEVNEEIWKRPKEFEIVKAWQFGYGFYVFGLSNNLDVPEWLDYKDKFDEELNGLLFFERSGNSYRAFLREDGKIFTEYDELEDWEDMELFDGNLYDYLIHQIDLLEKDYLEYIKK